MGLAARRADPEPPAPPRQQKGWHHGRRLGLCPSVTCFVASPGPFPMLDALLAAGGLGEPFRMTSEERLVSSPVLDTRGLVRPFTCHGTADDRRHIDDAQSWSCWSRVPANSPAGSKRHDPWRHVEGRGSHVKHFPAGKGAIVRLKPPTPAMRRCDQSAEVTVRRSRGKLWRLAPFSILGSARAVMFGPHVLKLLEHLAWACSVSLLSLCSNSAWAPFKIVLQLTKLPFPSLASSVQCSILMVLSIFSPCSRGEASSALSALPRFSRVSRASAECREGVPCKLIK